MNLYDLLDRGVIMAGHPDLDCVITWNGGTNFKWWNLDATSNKWNETDFKTVYGIIRLEQAERVVRDWVDEVMNGDEN